MKEEKKKTKREVDPDIPIEIPAVPIHGQPHDAGDVINKYGTYEIQPTSDNENRFPAIAQGLPEAVSEKYENQKTDFKET